MKKRILSIVLLLCFCLSGCGTAQTKEITCTDLIAAYEEAGYEVFHRDTTTEDYDWDCYVHVETEHNSNDVYFYFFDTAEAAKTYAQSRQWNVILWLYTAALFNPIWLTTKTYQNIEYEYTDSAVIRPFNELIG